MMKDDSTGTGTWRIAVATVIVTILLLLVPAPFPESFELVLRLAIAIAGLGVFVFLGFQVIARRAGLGVALILFLAGLALELVSFACLYRQDGVLCAVTQLRPDHTYYMAYVSRSDLASCVLLSVHVWTSVGYGTFVAKPSQGMLTGVEMLMGYVYMAVFIAILVAVLQERLAGARRTP